MRRGCEKELFLFYYVLLPESTTHTAAADIAMSEKSHPFWVTQTHTQTHTFTVRVCDCDTTSEQTDTRFVLHLLAFTYITYFRCMYTPPQSNTPYKHTQTRINLDSADIYEPLLKIFARFQRPAKQTSHCRWWWCAFVRVPHSRIPAPLWLRARDNPPSSEALAQLQVQCLMKQQQQIPAFISSALRDICCIIFDMSGADHQSAPLPLRFSPYNNTAFSPL